MADKSNLIARKFNLEGGCSLTSPALLLFNLCNVAYVSPSHHFFLLDAVNFNNTLMHDLIRYQQLSKVVFRVVG